MGKRLSRDHPKSHERQFVSQRGILEVKSVMPRGMRKDNGYIAVSGKQEHNKAVQPQVQDGRLQCHGGHSVSR